MNEITVKPLVALAQNTHIETERLLLRPMTVADLEDYHAFTSDDKLLKYNYHAHKDKRESLEGLVMYNMASPLGRYAIELKETQRMIGNIVLYLNEEQDVASIGYTLHAAYHHRGYATEAALALKDLVWEIAAIKTLVAHCDSRNTASEKVMKRIGMTFVKARKGATNLRGEVVTMLDYEIRKPG
ncbi:GNAT family N-acetyltransferase [Streptococcus himalayensis]|uniref:N-acetyltransferase n=1 Tax=Streptococcus himalayensis TaxID=1888195 RepID=A0A917A2E9_9STRE|nr:GNAT family N-acetyltransferase [Streptococcus himalayensis]GGE23203.1 N-acetyltransferase [Streptococcus himalayensis]